MCLLIQNGIMFAQQDTVLVFNGRLDTSSTGAQVVKPCLPRIERLSSDFGGIIKVECEEGMSEEMQYCIKVAAQLWEEKLYIPKNIILRFEKESLGIDADFAAQVVYTALPKTNMTYPKAIS